MIVVNIIVVVDLNLQISLNALQNVKYNPKKFSGAILKTELSTVLIFKNGKLVLTGVKKISDIDKNIEQVRHFLNDNRILKNVKYSIKNIVAVDKIKALKLNILYDKLRPRFKNIYYEPEIFPAIHIKEDHSCLTVFRSGKIISSGLQDLLLIENKFYNFRKLIDQHEFVRIHT